MGQARELAEAVTGALAAHDPQRARQWLADDFTFNDPNSPMPPPGPDEWLALQQTLINAFPDLNYNFEIFREEGNQVWVSANIGGTHNGDFDLSAMGMGVVPATGKRVSAGRSVTVGTLNNAGKVQAIEVVEDEGGGLPGMLQQIGVDLNP